MWLKDGKSHLHKKYHNECIKLGTKPISESKFHDGIKAGNFKEMENSQDIQVENSRCLFK